MAKEQKSKCVKKNGGEVSELETNISVALTELEQNNADLASVLKKVYFVSAKEIEVAQGKAAIVVFWPIVLSTKLSAVQKKLIQELEKKFNGKHVVFVNQRTILNKNYSKNNGGQKLPRSRTLTSVQEKIVEDIVYPAAIVGKRTRIRLDGQRLLKVYLDPNTKDVDYKLATFAAVYRKLTSKNVEFLFQPTN